MALPKDLLDILVCPESKQPLVYFTSTSTGSGSGSGEEDFLYCPASRLKYRVEDGIPVMLIEEGIPLDQVA